MKTEPLAIKTKQAKSLTIVICLHICIFAKWTLTYVEHKKLIPTIDVSDEVK